MSDKNEIYQQLFNEFKLGKKPNVAQSEFIKIWSDAKQKYVIQQDFLKWATDLLAEYRRKNKAKKSSNILFYCSVKTGSGSDNSAGGTKVPIKDPSSTTPAEEIPSTSDATGKRKASTLDDEASSLSSTSTSIQPPRATPAQDKLRAQIQILQSELDFLLRRRESLSASGDEQTRINKLRHEIDMCKKELRKKELHMSHSQKHRRVVKTKMELACQQNTDVASILMARSSPGRPRLDEQQPELLKTIVDLAMFGASAEERRRCELVRSCRTLTDLHEKLLEHGFLISRSATYLRLLPRKSSTIEGKRHVVTVPVKLSRPEADHHKAHPDQHFCVSAIRSLETVASILGPHQVFFLSQDDKARVPIGLTAANKQAPLLMHVEYRVSLPDHDWVVASRHKLIPSVYAGCVIKPNDMGRAEAIIYSGPTYVAIRSGKHASSTASSHAIDFDKLPTLDSFKGIMLNDEGHLKPVVLISSDGGPDENPRYAKVIAHAIEHFTKHDLDAIFIFTNAPGRSAFNRVERRMAPLSRELSGVILPHDYYGSHLDAHGRTINSNLEISNFKKAGDVLSEIWNDMIIDGHHVSAEYVEPNEVATVPDMPSPKWYSEHVRESQYLLQVVKCDDRDCCRNLRSSLRSVLPERFLTAPFPIVQSPNGLYVPKPQEHDGKSFAPFLLRQSLGITPSLEEFSKLPFDMYCPSLKDQLAGRMCTQCNIYFCAKKNVQMHKAVHQRPIEKKDNNKEIIRPTRILTRRTIARSQREVLCVMREDDDIEWQDEDDVEGVMPATCLPEDVCPVVTIATNQHNPWTDE